MSLLLSSNILFSLSTVMFFSRYLNKEIQFHKVPSADKDSNLRKQFYEVKLEEKENSLTIKVFIFVMTIFKTIVTNVI